MEQGAAQEIVSVSDHSADPDRLALARLARGDTSALEDIYSRFGRTLFRYLLTLVPDQQVAEELLQDTLVAAWRSAGSFQGRSSVRTWLFGIARRQAHNTLRQRLPSLADESELGGLAAADPEPEDAVLIDARREALAAHIERLAPLHREVLALIFFHELSYEEAAQVLEVPVGTVKSRLSNAKRALRGLLQASKEKDDEA